MSESPDMNKTSISGSEQPEADEVFALVTEVGQTFLEWSWEGTVGAEESIEGIGRAYGQNVTVIVTAETAAVQVGDKTAFLKAFPGFPPLAALPALKDWMIDVRQHRLTVSAARERLRSIRHVQPPYPQVIRILGSMLMSFAFAVDLVGTWQGCIVGLLTGIISGAVLLLSDRGTLWALAAPLIASFLVSLAVFLAFRVDLVTEAPGLLIIPALFVFLPGDSITVQALEMIEGRWSAGVSRLFYSGIMLVLLALGAVFANGLLGGSHDLLNPDAIQPAFSWWAIYPGHVAFTLGVALAFQMRPKDIPLAIVITLIVTVVAQGIGYLFGAITGTLLAAIAMTVLGWYVARSPKRAPAFVWMITPFFTLTPGSYGLKAVDTVISGQPAAAATDVRLLFATLVLIALGIAVGLALTAPPTRRRRHAH